MVVMVDALMHFTVLRVHVGDLIPMSNSRGVHLYRQRMPLAMGNHGDVA